jgi:hypothetical protein
MKTGNDNRSIRFVLGSDCSEELVGDNSVHPPKLMILRSLATQALVDFSGNPFTDSHIVENKRERVSH